MKTLIYLTALFIIVSGVVVGYHAGFVSPESVPLAKELFFDPVIEKRVNQFVRDNPNPSIDILEAEIKYVTSAHHESEHSLTSAGAYGCIFNA